MQANGGMRRNVGTLVGLATAGASMLVAGSASADPDRTRRVRTPGRVWVPPVFETVAREVILPAVYEERERRVWREPVYEERQIAVEIPAETVRREVPRYDRHGRLTGYDFVDEAVCAARTVWKTETVMVKPGCWEAVRERVLVRPEIRRTVFERVLVRAGHWNEPIWWTVRNRGPRKYVVPRAHGFESGFGTGFSGRR